MKEYGTPQEQESFGDAHVRRIGITESHKSLGHFISPKESRRTQTTQIREVCTKFNGILQQDNLSTKEYEALYKSVFTPTIKYILQGSHLTNTDLINSTKLTKHLFLQRMRLRHMQ